MTRIVACKGRPLTERQKAFALIYAREGRPAYQASTRKLAAAGFFPKTHAVTLLKTSRDCLPAYKAAIKAGYSPKLAHHRASMLLKDSRVWRVIDAELAAVEAAKHRRYRRRRKQADIAAARAEGRRRAEEMLGLRPRNERNLAHA